MTDCSKCASLCCIAPSISTPDRNQWRISGVVIKSINKRCEHICSTWCGIYGSRWIDRTACTQFDCKWFWPVLTQYLRENNGFTEKETLTEEGMRLFILLNWMLQKTFYWSKDSDLSDAISHFDTNKEWPEWMLKSEYRKFIIEPRLLSTPNPRFSQQDKILTQGKEKKKSLFQLAFSKLWL